MAAITRQVRTPILADESVFSPQMRWTSSAAGAADLINIKLMKTGGIWQALKICDVAEIYGVECMIGCMLESGCPWPRPPTWRPAAASSPGRIWTAPPLCSVDPYTGGPVFREAQISMSDDPGVGVDHVPCPAWT